MIHRLCVAASCLLAGCATTVTRTEHRSGASVDQLLLGIDWARAGDSVAQDLAAYLRIDTTNPPGAEARGAEYLAGLLSSAGIAAEVVPLSPGRASLIARLPGAGRGTPLCLLSHVDVAAAEASEWAPGRGPLSGAIQDGFVFGRGALDMKGMGMLEAHALIWLKRLSVPLQRDVILLAVADEEVGNRGIQQLLEERWDRIGCSHALNEGGIGVRDLIFQGQTFYAISYAEKGFLWLRAVAKGTSGHGSTPRDDSAPARLLSALERIRANPPSAEVQDGMWELLAAAGEAHGGFSGFVLRRPFLAKTMGVVGDLMDNPVTRAVVSETVNITGLSTPSGEPNVVPGVASATLDVRLLPGRTPEAALADLRETIGDDLGVELEVVGAVAGNESPLDDPLYQALVARTAEGREDAAAGPAISPGFTDSIYLRSRGVRAYGLVPFELHKEELAGMHGPNERVSIENLRRGLRTLLAVVLDVSTVRR